MLRPNLVYHADWSKDENKRWASKARNMSFAFLVSAIAIGATHFYGAHPVRLRWFLLAAFASVSLFYRYLKFFHQFSYELFLRYAELPRS